MSKFMIPVGRPFNVRQLDVVKLYPTSVSGHPSLLTGETRVSPGV